MRIFYKILASILLFSSIIITFFIGAGLTIEGINIFSPFIDTRFAPQYSRTKFNLIKPGQSIKEVEAIIGQPIYKSNEYSDHRTAYWYTMDGKLNLNNKAGDFAWYRSAIYFNNQGKVIEIDKGWSFD